jgi:hypothetical protein
MLNLRTSSIFKHEDSFASVSFCSSGGAFFHVQSAVSWFILTSPARFSREKSVQNDGDSNHKKDDWNRQNTTTPQVRSTWTEEIDPLNKKEILEKWTTNRFQVKASPS